MGKSCCDVPVVDEQEELEITEAEMSQAVKEYYLSIYSKLAESKRFRDFIAANFDIHQEINEEEKTIDILVVEKPVAVGPALSANQILKLQGVLGSYGVVDTVAAVQAVMRVLGQEQSIIVTDTKDIKV